jgi:AhpD family alkylhydroperoxidase
MTTLEVFDPPMCCSTGVCGPEPDVRLTHFAADLDWLKSQGVAVHRYNLAQEPTRFTANPRVKQIVDALGIEGLPVVVVDGHMVSQGEYPSRDRLRTLANLGGPSAETTKPATAVAEQPPIFNEWVAELVALGAAIASNCEPCFQYHHRKAVELGISQDDMVQAVNVALRVKEQPAQAMVRLAQKHLVPDASRTGSCCGGEDKTGCC